MICAPGRPQILFLLTQYSFSIFRYKEYNEFDLGIGHLVMSMCKVVSCVVEKGYLLSLEHPLGRIQLTFALLHFVLLLACYSRYILTSSFWIPIPDDEWNICFRC